MSGFRNAAIRAGLDLIWGSQAPRLVRRFSRARGVIFALHRVLPEDAADFSPNAGLQVKPEFLEFAIKRVRELGLDIVDLGEGLRRIETDEPTRPFAIFTFDDAYRDNLKHALPILRLLQCPFTLYVPTALVDGVGEVWWQALEDIIAAQTALAVTYAGETDYLDCATLEQKQVAFDIIYLRMRAMPEADRVALIRDLAGQYGLDLQLHCREMIMDWSELKTFADEQLCTIGAHSVHHYELAKLDADEARNEMSQSIRIIKAQFGAAPLHFAYPDGGSASAGPREYEMARELGLRSAVTSRRGGLYAEHRSTPHALPRVSLNGLFQSRRHFDVFATPALFSLLKQA